MSRGVFGFGFRRGRGITQPLGSDLRECPAIAVEDRVTTGVSLPTFDGDVDALLPQASAALRKVDGGHGVLVLTDLYGATPSNIAAKLSRLGTPVRRVSALSLPMLLRVMNYADLPLDELPAVAAAGARNGVIHDDA